MKWNVKFPVLASHRERLAQDDDDTSFEEEKIPDPSTRVLDWKPLILRSFPLLLLLAISLLGIGLLQYAVNVLPHAAKSRSAPADTSLRVRAEPYETFDLYPRAVNASNSGVATNSGTSGQNITGQATTTPNICTVSVTAVQTISSGTATVFVTQTVTASGSTVTTVPPSLGARSSVAGAQSCTCSSCVTVTLLSTYFVPLGTVTVTYTNVGTGSPPATTHTSPSVFVPVGTISPTLQPSGLGGSNAASTGVSAPAPGSPPPQPSFVPLGPESPSVTIPSALPTPSFIPLGTFSPADQPDGTTGSAPVPAPPPGTTAADFLSRPSGTVETGYQFVPSVTDFVNLGGNTMIPVGTTVGTEATELRVGSPAPDQILPLGPDTFTTTELTTPIILTTGANALMPTGSVTFAVAVTPSPSGAGAPSNDVPLGSATFSTSAPPTGAAPPSIDVPVGSAIFTASTTSTTDLLATGSVTFHGSVTVTSILYVTNPSTTFATATVIGILIPAPTANASTDATPALKSDVYTWTLQDVFVSTYLPVLLAVLYKMWWGAVQEKMSLIDPFRQMSRAEGAPANKALFSAYHKNTAILGIFPSLTDGRWTLALTRLAYILALIIPALASEAITVDTRWGCPYVPETKLNPCPARTSTYMPVLRALQAFLAVCSLAAVILLRSLWISETGLRNDPGSIGAVAELMQHPHVIDDIRNLTGKNKVLAQRSLVGKTYVLGHYQKSSTGSLHYGIRPLAVEDLSHESSRDARSPASADEPLLRDHNLALKPRQAARARANLLKDAFMSSLLVGSFGVILAYELDWQADGFNNFFNSTTIGPRFILVLTSSLIVYHWKRTEHDAVVMAPFTRLSKAPADYHSTIAYEPSVIPFISTVSAFVNRYWFVGIITIIALLGEALSVVISGVPASSGQVWIQNQISIILSLIVLGTMLIAYVFVLRYRKHEPNIPRPPSTLGVKMSYLAESRMLTSLTPETECLNRGNKFVLKQVAWGGKGWRWVIDRADSPVDEDVAHSISS